MKPNFAIVFQYANKHIQQPYFTLYNIIYRYKYYIDLIKIYFNEKDKLIMRPNFTIIYYACKLDTININVLYNIQIIYRFD